MKFTKMHGCGNDYVYVNCFERRLQILPKQQNRSATAILVLAPTVLFSSVHRIKQISAWLCIIWMALRARCAEMVFAVSQNMSTTII